MAYANTFKRREMKFLLDKGQFTALMEHISVNLHPEEFGSYTVKNIYLDNQNFDLIRSSLGKPIYKEKLRLRSYGETVDDSQAFLEIKKKLRGITYKRRLELTYKELHDYITEGTVPSSDGQVYREVDYMIKRMSLTPRIVICYDREGFYDVDDKEFRVTFDGNIRYRHNDLDLRAGDYGETLDAAPYRIMEVKSAGAIPLWLVRELSALRIYHGSFSKFGTIYQTEARKRQLIVYS